MFSTSFSSRSPYFPNTFQHDKPLYTPDCDCTIRRRIDHRKLIGNTLLCIETDENQHKYYSQQDEEDRYNDAYMGFASKWIWIRFNPDKYKGKDGKNKNPTISTRLRELKKEIDHQMERIRNEDHCKDHCKDNLIEVIYMYYDK